MGGVDRVKEGLSWLTFCVQKLVKYFIMPSNWCMHSQFLWHKICLLLFVFFCLLNVQRPKT